MYGELSDEVEVVFLGVVYGLVDEVVGQDYLDASVGL